MTLRVVELFAGIGAQAMALEELGMPFTSTVCEIDVKAYASYCAIHGIAPNLGDITKVEHLPDQCDLLTYSFPCQDLSVAGAGRGMAEGSGTRSSLLWEVGRLLIDAVQRGTEPDVLVMENVPAILFKKNKPEFDRWLATLQAMGYTSSFAILNAKDYGVPQNRARCFCVSMKGGRKLTFPEPCPDGRVLKDVLEADPDPSLFLSAERIAAYERHADRHSNDGLGWEPRTGDDVSRVITTNPDRQGGTFIIVSGRIPLKGWHDLSCRIYADEGISPTICARTGGGIIPRIEVEEPELRIRLLSPRECWRLQGFPDKAFDAAKSTGAAKTTLYKQAGNSIAVPCLKAIFKAIYIDKAWTISPTMEAWA